MALHAEDLHRFEVDEYLDLVEAHPGVLERTELVDGMILDVSPESWLHAEAVKAVDDQLNVASGGRSRRNGSVRLSTRSLWNPDVFVVREGAAIADYPSARDVELVVEVALFTANRDLGAKLDVYAAEAIPQYWVVIPSAGGLVIVHRDPRDGAYRSVEETPLPGGYEDLDAAALLRPR